MFSLLLDGPLSRAAHPPAFLFRDDDADRDCPELHRLLELFGEAGVPLCLAVIPGTLTPDGAVLLRRAAEQTKGAFELHQHGWMHRNHEPEASRKCEFGPSRDLAAQREDIRMGRDRLADLLGGAAARPLFTPPWNRCTAATYEALAGLGFAAISRDASPPPAAVGGLTEVPVAVDIFRWKQGPALKTREEIAAEIAARLASPEPVGILLHHKVMSGGAFELVRELAGYLASSAAVRRVRFTTIEEAALACDAATRRG